jgi:hypothetical protein
MTHRDWLVRVQGGIMWVEGERCIAPRPRIEAAIKEALGEYPVDTHGYYAIDDAGDYFVVSKKDVTP